MEAGGAQSPREGGRCPSALSPGNAAAGKSRKEAAVADRFQACRLRKTLGRLRKLQEEKELFIQETRWVRPRGAGPGWATSVPEGLPAL